MFDNKYIYLSIQSVWSFHSLHHIAQVGIADVLEVGLVVDVEELQFISHDTNADDDPGTTALATTLRGDGETHLASSAFQFDALHRVLKQRVKQSFEVIFQRLVTLLQPFVGGAEILRDLNFHSALSAATASS